MSLFPFLQLQPVEPDDTHSRLDEFERDEITLDDAIDGEALERSWSGIVEDIEADPEWQSFYNADN